MVEDERAEGDRIRRVATVFLTGRECAWRCVMCDLWRHTIVEDTPRGAIPAQLDQALAALGGSWAASHIKLYNSSSFLDPRAVPTADYAAIVARAAGVDRLTIESHPALVEARIDDFLGVLSRQAKAPALEVAIGLETAHPEALEQLNKGMSVPSFARSAAALKARSVGLRVFLLIAPPFVPVGLQDFWLLESIAAAFQHDAFVVSLIPTRAGNGAMEALASGGLFREPNLGDIERSFALGLQHRPDGRRVFVDLWNLEKFADCSRCLDERHRRLHAMNLSQLVLPRVACEACGGCEA